MKLFCDVIDASWPAVGVSWPVREKSKMFEGSIVNDVCALACGARGRAGASTKKRANKKLTGAYSRVVALAR